jgi:hypothetical protein
LKQLLVVFTPYPGLAAVRKIRFSLKGEWREQPFFLAFCAPEQFVVYQSSD